MDSGREAFGNRLGVLIAAVAGGLASSIGAALWDAVRPVFNLLTPTECPNYFKAAGYDPK